MHSTGLREYRHMSFVPCVIATRQFISLVDCLVMLALPVSNNAEPEAHFYALPSLLGRW